MNRHYDLVVIGSGPGGYVAAIQAAKLGMKTAIIENREIGGTCLNRGCIPTKTLMHSAQMYREAKNFKEAGIYFEGLSYDLERIQERKDNVVDKMRQGIISLLKANGVDILYGTGKIIARGKVLLQKDTLKMEEENRKKEQKEQKQLKERNLDQEKAQIPKDEHGQILKEDKERILYVEKEQKLERENEQKPEEEKEQKLEEVIETDKILIATGSSPIIPPIQGFHSPKVVTSDELLSNSLKFQKLLIIGGGVIGIEFASLYADLGCEVEIIEAMERVLPQMDREISQSVTMSLKKRGVSIRTQAKVTRIEPREGSGLACEYEEKGGLKETKADLILMAVGRKANTQDLIAKDLTLEYDGPFLKVDDNFETNLPGIYAIGDVVRGKQLAHLASAQGIVAVEKMCGKDSKIDLSLIPSCIYTSPEVAVVGLTEDEAKALGKNVKVGKYPMLGNGKTLLSMGERGFIKVICDAQTDKIIGAQLLCDRATDMVSEFTTAIANQLRYQDLASVIRPHPTYNEAVTEALEDIEGMAIHLVPRRR